MSPNARMVELLDRIAVTPAIVRTRREDARRIELNGGINGQIIARAETLIARLEKAVEQIEKAI